MTDELAKLSSIGSKDTTSKIANFPTKTKPDLLIGSSIIKEMATYDRKILKIRSESGAKINSVISTLRDMEDHSYACVTLIIGGNDCNPSTPEDEIITGYHALINEATRVADDKVRICSICPRIDPVRDAKIQAVNAQLKQIAANVECTFIDNDDNFRLRDGTADDSLLQADGVHLTSKGVNRLLSNLNLTKNAYYRKISPKNSKPVPNTQASSAARYTKPLFSTVVNTPVPHHTSTFQNMPSKVEATQGQGMMTPDVPRNTAPLQQQQQQQQQRQLPNLCRPPPSQPYLLPPVYGAP